MPAGNFHIVNRTRGITPRLPFRKMKNEVLGEDYDLSLALLAPTQARAVTRQTKHKDKASNGVAFPLSKHSGEILLCPATARAQAKDFGMSARNFLGYLFIHGLLHIKGHAHGGRMESAEKKLCERFGLCKKSSQESTSVATRSR